MTVFAAAIVVAVYAGQKFDIIPKAKFEYLKRAETTKRTEVVLPSVIPLATNYGSVSKVETDTGNSSGMAVGQTVNYSASNLHDSSSWAADARVVGLSIRITGSLGQSVLRGVTRNGLFKISRRNFLGSRV